MSYLTSPSLNYASQPTELQETLIDLPLPSVASSVQNGDEFLPPAWVQWGNAWGKPLKPMAPSQSCQTRVCRFAVTLLSLWICVGLYDWSRVCSKLLWKVIPIIWYLTEPHRFPTLRRTEDKFGATNMPHKYWIVKRKRGTQEKLTLHITLWLHHGEFQKSETAEWNNSYILTASPRPLWNGTGLCQLEAEGTGVHVPLKTSRHAL